MKSEDQGDNITTKPWLVRGAEWYVFRDGLIVEIRAYYMNPHLPYLFTNLELEDFPYKKRSRSTQ